MNSNGGVPRAADDVALMVLLPDMMRQDVWEGLGQRLELHDLDVVGATPMVLHPHHVARLYAANIEQPASARRKRLDSTWLGPGIFRLDMCVPLVIRSRRHDDIPLAERLAGVKGDASAAGRRPHELRGVSPIADRAVSLLHSSDDTARAWSEGRALFLGDLFDRIAFGEAARRVRWADLQDLRGYVPLTAEIHPYDILLRLLLRALTTLAVDAHLRVDPAVEAERDRLASERQALMSRPGIAPGDVWDALASFADNVAGLDEPALAPMTLSFADELAAGALLRRRQELREAAIALTRPRDHDAIVGHFVVHAFVENGLHLDDMERHRAAAAFALHVDELAGTDWAPAEAAVTAVGHP